MKILLIDDEKSLVKGLKSSLEFQGFDVDTAFSGSEAFKKFNAEYDFIILDLMLPQIDGMSLCRMFKEKSDVPIITADRRDHHDRIAGLDTGADDCDQTLQYHGTYSPHGQYITGIRKQGLRQHSTRPAGMDKPADNRVGNKKCR